MHICCAMQPLALSDHTGFCFLTFMTQEYTLSVTSACDREYKTARWFKKLHLSWFFPLLALLSLCVYLVVCRNNTCMPFLLLKKREKKVSVFSCLCVSSRRTCFLLFSAEWHVFVCVYVCVGGCICVCRLDRRRALSLCLCAEGQANFECLKKKKSFSLSLSMCLSSLSITPFLATQRVHSHSSVPHNRQKTKNRKSERMRRNFGKMERTCAERGRAKKEAEECKTRGIKWDEVNEHGWGLRWEKVMRKEKRKEKKKKWWE